MTAIMEMFRFDQRVKSKILHDEINRARDILL